MSGIPRAVEKKKKKKKKILEFPNNSDGQKSLEFQHPLSAYAE